MKKIKLSNSQVLALAVYLYLGLPVLIFLVGWCHWYVSMPIAVIVIIAMVKAVREHKGRVRIPLELSGRWFLKIGFILVLIILWVILSGVGGYAWQCDDHPTRNALFLMMQTEEWPLVGVVDVDGAPQTIMLSYYLGFWLPAALVGKMFGPDVGNVALVVWAVLGIMLFYLLVCIWQRKVAVWPLVLFIFFSGLDIVGMSLMRLDVIRVFDPIHIEWWYTDYNFQFSSITTQLFWVFNQAIPAWIATVYIFLYEKPRNMVFVLSLLLITATFPLAGLLPLTIFYMIKRGRWKQGYATVPELLRDIVRNWVSWQNVVAGGCVGIVCMLFTCSNQAVMVTFESLFDISPLVVLAAIGILLIAACGIMKLVLLGRGKWVGICGVIAGVFLFCRLVKVYPFEEWQSPVFGWADMTIFYILEVGLFFVCIYDAIPSKLLWMNAITLYVIPIIRVGYYADFCMRASIPGLTLLALWCIDAIRRRRNTFKIYVLTALLIVGAVTPIHEMERVYVNTNSQYENQIISREDLLLSHNYRGASNSFFAKYIAK